MERKNVDLLVMELLFVVLAFIDYLKKLLCRDHIHSIILSLGSYCINFLVLGDLF